MVDLWKVLYTHGGLKVCAHCRKPVDAPSGVAISWHGHHYHLYCAGQLLIVDRMSRGELIEALARVCE